MNKELAQRVYDLAEKYQLKKFEVMSSFLGYEERKIQQAFKTYVINGNLGVNEFHKEVTPLVSNQAMDVYERACRIAYQKNKGV